MVKSPILSRWMEAVKTKLRRRAPERLKIIFVFVQQISAFLKQAQKSFEYYKQSVLFRRTESTQLFHATVMLWCTKAQILFVPNINLPIQSKHMSPLLSKVSLFLCRASYVNLAELAVNLNPRPWYERHGSILDFTSQTILQCKSVCDVKSRIDPWVQIIARFD